MIADSPYITDFAVGAERVIVQAGDSRLEVPPVLSPVVLALKPTYAEMSSVVAQNNSCIFEALQTRTNQAANTIVFATLGRGLWELELNMSSFFNYSTPGGLVDGTKVEMGYINSFTRLVNRWAVAGSHQDYNRLRFLLIQNATLQLVSGITALAETSDVHVVVNCIRIL